MPEQESRSLHWTFTFMAIGASFGSLGIGWVTFNSVINHLQIILVVLLLAVLSFFPFRNYFRRKNLEMQHMPALFCLFGFGPAAACFLFCLNTYIPVTDEFTEKYKIESILTLSADGINEKKSIVKLENNAYNEYRSLRTFYDRNLGSNDKYVVFTFRRGLLGIKQLRHVKFSVN